jgi:Tfp pilus assembly protein PilN
MVNIGLALRELLPEKEGANFSLVNLNVLPEVYVPPRFSILRVLVPVGIVIGIGLIIFGVILVLNNRAEIEALRSQVTVAETSVTQKQIEIGTLSAQVGSLGAIASELDNRVTVMERERASIYLDLREIKTLTPEGLQLVSINHNGNSITVSGTAPNVGLIYSYARALRSSPRFSKVWVSSITGGEGGFSFAFSLTK